MSLAISTTWNAFRCTDAQPMIRELTDLGFKRFELSFNLTSGMVDTIKALVSRKVITVTSVHNFCPIPEGVAREEALPDFFSVASLDENERRRAVAGAKRSIDTTVDLNAKAVVLHCGRVEMGDITRDLVRIFDRAGRESPEFLKLRAEMIRRRRELAPRYFESALRSLDELNAYADTRGVRLGIETRYYYNEIPSHEEIGMILASFKGGSIRYWHDTGHAQVSENLGLATQKDFLSSYGAQLLGMHLHDARGSSDHKALGQGDIDFSIFTPFISADTIKVLEIHHPAGPQEIIRSKEVVETVFHGKI